MDTAKNLLETQASLGDQLTKLFLNFSKANAAQKAKLSYICDKIKEAKDSFKKFKDNHDKLEAIPGLSEDDAYFTENYFEQIKLIYNKQFNVLLDHQLQVIAKESDNTSSKSFSPSDETSSVGNNGLDSKIKLQRVQMQVLRSKIASPAPLANANAMQLYYENIHNQFNQISQSQQDIFASVENVEVIPPEVGIDTFHKLQGEVFNFLGDLQKKINELTNATTPSTNNQSLLKLPNIDLPKFDGDFKKWPTFRTLFEEMVHHRDISDICKMVYLQQALEGDAVAILGQLEQGQNNYQGAWGRVKETYENPRQLTFSIANRFFSQPNIKEESASGLKLLFNVTKESIVSFRSLNITFDSCEPLMVFLLLKKLDYKSRELFEDFVKSPRDTPTMDQFLNFLEHRFQALDNLNKKGSKQPQSTERQFESKTNTSSTQQQNSTQNVQKFCLFCKSNEHKIFNCSKFLQLSIPDRKKTLTTRKICHLCLKNTHKTESCKLRPCSIDSCGRRHNSLLHLPKENPSKNCLLISRNDDFLFLGTALVTIKNHKGRGIVARAIIDTGSQVNLVSESMTRKLGLRPTSKHQQISCGNSSSISTCKQLRLEIAATYGEYDSLLDFLVIPNITSYKPEFDLNIQSILEDKGIKMTQLADPNFCKPDNIDMLLNVQVYNETRGAQVIKLGEKLPTLYETKFGWIALGQYSPNALNCHLTTVCEDQYFQDIPRLWELDEPISKQLMTTEEKTVESFFEETTRRENSGRFVVKLPKGKDFDNLSESFIIAKNRFISLERRFKRDPELFNAYKSCLQEYLDSGHMVKIDPGKVPDIHFYLPHHSVVKEQSSTTKLRVVFDGSVRMSSKTSLNDTLLKGPNVQDSLFSILVRFRFPRYVCSADIAQMYRQIVIDQEDQNLQLILWRNKPNEEFKIFKLTRLTFGTKPAPYLATKCLQKISKEILPHYPEASGIIKSNFYVDDLLFGSDSVIRAKDLQKQISQILNNYGFHLRKWCSNKQSILENIPPQDHECKWDPQANNNIIKTLGVIWNASTDSFQINCQTKLPDSGQHTKRSVSSSAGSIFDPLGLVMPTVVIAKLMLQDLWQLKINWDDPIPSNLSDKWNTFLSELHILQEISVPRHTLNYDPVDIQIHGFSDASEKAYGAVIYVRSTSMNGKINVHLLCSKSKVAPLHKRSLARLELCGALMLAELIDKVKSSIAYNINTMYYWTDSTIVLSWIQRPSSTLKTFVANRVADIQATSDSQQWFFIPGKINPADYLSRGLLPSELINCSYWFRGPEFLSMPQENWNMVNPTFTEKDEDLELKVVHLTTESSEVPHFIEVINHRNSMRTFRHVIVFILRFCNNCKRKNKSSFTIFNKVPPILVEELTQANHCWVKYLQEKHSIASGMNSSYKNLVPFVDDKGLIRVGGRIQNSTLPYSAKHPLLIPKDPITKLLVSEVHTVNHHTGPKTTLAFLRQYYWLLSGARITNQVFRECVRCVRSVNATPTQQMGNLPQNRVTPIAPFSFTGIDLAGPYTVHYKGRGTKPTKVYLALFICCSIKAVHLDLVTDLTSEAFLACLRRFIARRGKPIEILSDNATNFMGARDELKRLYQVLIEKQDDITQSLADQGIKWNPIPARSPHFGGLWESNIRRAKEHFTRSINGYKLTYEQFLTVIAEVEFILNSRPLTPSSNNPNDVRALCPSDFLIQGTILSLPEPSKSQCKSNILGQWEVISCIRKEFWERFTTEYVTSLQKRLKWCKVQKNIKKGTVVVLKDSNTTPMKWNLGLIDNVVYGKDGLVRVVEVLTNTGSRKRAITEIVPLPVMAPTEEVAENSLEDTLDNKTDHSSKAALADLSDSEIVKTSDSSKICSKSIPSDNISASSSNKNKDSDSNHAKNSKTNVTKSKICTNLLNLTLCCLLIMPILGQKCNVTKFDVHPGIYYDGVGEVNLITNNWHLINYYNMSTYWDRSRQINFLSSRVKALCKTPVCKQAVNELDQQLQDIQLMNKLIKKECQFTEFQRNIEPDSRSTRVRRGAIDVIGNIASDLFGVLDSRYASKLEKTLQIVKENQDHNLNLIKQHTSILEQTSKIIKDNQEVMVTKFNEINDHLNTINTATIDNSNTIRYNTLMEFLILVIQKYRETQWIIHNVLKEFKAGKLNPMLLGPDEFEEQLQSIQSKLGYHLKLPSTQYEELQDLLEVAVVHGESCLIFSIDIPILNTDRFLLYKLIPVPTVVKGNFVSIKPTTDYMAINSQLGEYYFMNAKEYINCKTIRELNICDEKHAVYHINEHSHCELQMYHHPHDTNSKCDMQVFLHDQVWIELQLTNTWIYASKFKDNAKVTCGNHIEFVPIAGEGILKLEAGCVIQTKRATLSARKRTISKHLIKRIPPVLPYINASIFESIPTSRISSALNKTLVIKLTDSTKQMTDSLEKVKEQQALTPIDMNDFLKLPTLHDCLSYVFSGILLIGIVFYVIIKKCCKQQTPSVITSPTVVVSTSPVRAVTTSSETSQSASMPKVVSSNPFPSFSVPAELL